MATLTLRAVCLLAILATTLNAASDWARVTRLPPEAQVRLLLENKKKVKGRFAAADADSVTLTRKNGSSQTIPRSSVRRAEAKGPVSRYAPLIGALAGAILVGAVVGTESFDATGQAILVMAAGGGAAGFGIGSAFRYSVLYER